MPDVPVIDLAQPVVLILQAGPNRYRLSLADVHLYPELIPPEPALWVLPVGSEKYPHWAWYCAQAHTWSKDNPAGHTGLDINVQLDGKGDVDYHQPVYFLTNGEVQQVAHSNGWLGVIIVRHEHEAKPIWFRYAHLDPSSITVKPGDLVQPAQTAGLIGAYPKEGDHLHLDCAWESFWWAAYKTKTTPWTDPRPILQAHIPPLIVAQMLQDRDAP